MRESGARKLWERPRESKVAFCSGGHALRGVVVRADDTVRRIHNLECRPLLSAEVKWPDQARKVLVGPMRGVESSTSCGAAGRYVTGFYALSGPALRSLSFRCGD